MSDEKQCCGNCRFEGGLMDEAGHPKRFTCCRRRAPTTVRSGPQFPLMKIGDWCGEWERRVPPRFRSGELIYGREPGQIESIGPYNDENYSAGLVGGKSILVSKEEGLYIFSRIQSEITRKVKNL